MKLIDIKPNSERWLDLTDLPFERWVDIKNYEGLYKISDYGRVKTLARRRVKESIKRCDINKGYLRVSLSKNGKDKHYFIHILVAIAFIPNPNNYPEINHKDENPMNCKFNNLEWCNHLYNLMYGNRRKKVIEKERKPVNQYTLDDKFVTQHYSIQEAGRFMNKSAGPICLCCKGKQKYAYGYKWRYANKGGDE